MSVSAALGRLAGSVFVGVFIIMSLSIWGLSEELALRLRSRHFTIILYCRNRKGGGSRNIVCGAALKPSAEANGACSRASCGGSYHSCSPESSAQTAATSVPPRRCFRACSSARSADTARSSGAVSQRGPRPSTRGKRMHSPRRQGSASPKKLSGGRFQGLPDERALERPEEAFSGRG
jgi:hypothetical protein